MPTVAVAVAGSRLVGIYIRPYSTVMKRNVAAWTGIAALGVFLLLFEVRLDFEFSLPAQKRLPDPHQEGRYAACFEARDREIHETAFGTIDNPDVQKLYISNNRDRAAAECREKFPQQWITVEEPFRFNLLDLHFRY